MDGIEFTWRGDFTNAAIGSLHAEAFEHPEREHDWRSMVERHSLGWVTATDSIGLVGFVNVLWDGDMHAWLQDLAVLARARRQGIGHRIVGVAAEHVKAAGCQWLHVDFAPAEEEFYVHACGFRPSRAGLMAL